MAYIPNATDVTEPVESQTVESAALEFRTLKTSVNGRLASLQAELDAEEVARAAGDSNLQAQLGLETAERIGADSGLNARLFGIETLVATIGTGPVSNANSVIFQPAGTGAVATTVQGKLRERVSAEDFFIAGESDATVMIQRAIDAVHEAGGGEVDVLREYFVSASVSTEQFWFADIATKHTASAVTALILRSGVSLVGRGSHVSKITCTNRSRTVVSCLSMDGGGIRNMHIRSTWTPAYTNAGHGIMLCVSELNDSNKNLVFENLEISNVGSYGIGAQWGNFKNNRYDKIYVHDVGADGIDHKVRGGVGVTSSGVSFSNILCERFGQRSGITGSAGIDIRGPATVTNYVARSFGAAGGVNTGIRFSAGVYDANGVDNRQPSSLSALTNFLIESDHLFNTTGVVLLSSEATKVSNGSIKNCNTFGVAVETSSSGYGDSRRSKIHSVSVSGTRSGTAFKTQSKADNVSFVDCDSWGESTEFSDKQGNLVEGQTVFSVDYLPATVKVYKNGALLTNGVDVTASSGTSITVAVAVLATDSISVITPNQVGFDIVGKNNIVALCATQHTTTPEIIDPAAAGSFRRIGNEYEGAGGIRAADGPARLEVFGTAASLDFRVDAKGSGGFEARAFNGRAFRASNSASGAVNWVQATGGVAGSGVIVAAQGSDPNIDLYLLSKGGGNVRFGAHTTSADAPISGYITIKDASGVTRKLAVIS